LTYVFVGGSVICGIIPNIDAGWILYCYAAIPICLIYQIIYFIVISYIKNKKEIEERKELMEVEKTDDDETIAYIENIINNLKNKK
jgi:phosphotransferase system  glucose/maltose/N-acetylglucosamine-specific IIC component